jgi:integrase
VSLRKRKGSPFWWYDFTIDGERYRGSTDTEDKRLAEKIETKLRNEVVEGQYFQKARSITIGQAAERYYQEVAQHQPSGRHADAKLDRMVAFFGENTKLSDITSDSITRYIAERRKTVSNSTVNDDLSLMRRLWRRAQLEWERDIGKMPRWSRLMLPAKTERVRYLKADEEARLWEAVERVRPDYEPVIRFALMCGQRVSNVIGLRWKDIDWDHGVIAFHNVKSRKPGGEIHHLPITPEMVELIETQKGNHPTFVFTYIAQPSCRGKTGSVEGEKLIAGKRYPISYSSISWVWGTILKAAGIDDLHIHDLRHTVATRALKQTGSLRIVKEILGHSNIQTTMRYTHVDDGDVREAMEKLTARHKICHDTPAGTVKPLKRLA